MAQGTSDTILVAIRITLRIRESKVRNPDPPYYSLIVSCRVRRRFVLSERILVCGWSSGDEVVEMDGVNEIIARCEERARSLLAGTVFDDRRPAAPPDR